MLPESLNYQPSRSAVYYRPPSKLNLGRTLVGTCGAAILTIAGAIAYAKLLPELESFYLRGGAVCAAGIATGLLALAAVRFGKVRSPVIAAFIGAALGLLALYVMWLVWVLGVIRAAGYSANWWKLILHPVVFFDLIRGINRFGTWSYKGYEVRGGALLFWWIGEAAIVLGAAVMIAINSIKQGEAICRHCGAKCAYAGLLRNFDAQRQSDVVGAVENRNFASLASFPPPDDEDDPEIKLRLLSCPKCGQMHVLTVSHLAWYADANGVTKVEAKVLVNQLIVTPEEAGEIKKLVPVADDETSGSPQTESDT